MALLTPAFEREEREMMQIRDIRLIRKKGLKEREGVGKNKRVSEKVEREERVNNDEFIQIGNGHFLRFRDRCPLSPIWRSQCLPAKPRLAASRPIARPIASTEHCRAADASGEARDISVSADRSKLQRINKIIDYSLMP